MLIEFLLRCRFHCGGKIGVCHQHCLPRLYRPYVVRSVAAVAVTGSLLEYGAAHAALEKREEIRASNSGNGGWRVHLIFGLPRRHSLHRFDDILHLAAEQIEPCTAPALRLRKLCHA